MEKKSAASLRNKIVVAEHFNKQQELSPVHTLQGRGLEIATFLQAHICQG